MSRSDWVWLTIMASVIGFGVGFVVTLLLELPK